MKNRRKSLWCVCVPQWPWVELQLINSIDDVALALLFFCSQCWARTWESRLPTRGRREEAEQAGCAVFLQERGSDHTSSHCSYFFHYSFATFMWSTGWKSNLMTCLQARNMILKPVTVKQRCHLHNDPSKIGLQPLPWQLVDKQKNGERVEGMDGRLGGWCAGQLIAVPGLRCWEGGAPALRPLHLQAGRLSSNGIDPRVEVRYPGGHYGF